VCLTCTGSVYASAVASALDASMLVHTGYKAQIVCKPGLISVADLSRRQSFCIDLDPIGDNMEAYGIRCDPPRGTWPTCRCNHTGTGVQHAPRLRGNAHVCVPYNINMRSKLYGASQEKAKNRRDMLGERLLINTTDVRR